MSKQPIRLINLFRYYRGLPHQTAAINELERVISERLPDVFTRDNDWYVTWTSDPPPKDYAVAKELISQFEGCHLNAYLCPAGVPTIGWGSTRYPDGSSVRLGQSITQQRADEFLTLEIERIAKVLEESVPYWDDMNINQKSALISFGYNLGAYFYNSSGFATISRVLTSKAWDEVPNAMYLYRNPGSHFEAGLARRRIAEGDLFMKQA
jgi:GH24 family phage-related lysozyme (muramidase)